MVNNSLRFTNPFIKKWDYSAKQFFTDGPVKIKMSASYNTNVNKSNNERSAEVELMVSIGADTEERLFDISLIISSVFTWDDTLDNDIDKLLTENGTALLLSYVRPLVTQFTASAGIPPVVLPYINIVNDDNNAQ